MHRQIKNFVLISIAFALLVTVLMQSACRDYLSREEFIYKMTGEWQVITLNHAVTPNNPVWVEIQVYEDGIYYRTADGDHTYRIYDTILCTLPHMEKIQNWTITENNNDLFLETRDLCGVIKNYKIEFSNYQYHTEWGRREDIDGIDADIYLAGPDTLITFYNFSLRKSFNPDQALS